VGGGLQRHQAPLDEVRHQGIRDFKTFIKVHPEFVSRCMQEIRVIDVNQQTLQMFGAQSKANCTNQISRVFRGEMHDLVCRAVAGLWDGKLVQQREVINYALSGDAVHIHMQLPCWRGTRTTGAWCCCPGGHHGAQEGRGLPGIPGQARRADTAVRNRAFYVEELNASAQGAVAAERDCH
jgi:hypothetical protein